MVSVVDVGKPDRMTIAQIRFEIARIAGQVAWLNDLSALSAEEHGAFQDFLDELRKKAASLPGPGAGDDGSAEAHAEVEGMIMILTQDVRLAYARLLA